MPGKCFSALTWRPGGNDYVNKEEEQNPCWDALGPRPHCTIWDEESSNKHVQAIPQGDNVMMDTHTADKFLRCSRPSASTLIQASWDTSHR